MREREKEDWKRKERDVTTPGGYELIYIYIYIEERRKEEGIPGVLGGERGGQVTVAGGPFHQTSEYRGRERFIGFVYGGSPPR